ncbi:flagellar protein FliT [Noviherbaspirillum sp. DKR-6]|uniref:Flagellar protein FliT n=2 Tax=Noviherbaspirillum pedocola TaxID=2801341 RepID=A0A934SWF2_9BURK|nr:flagellar protein FliT [Noviherbaspirillum pedocola]
MTCDDVISLYENLSLLTRQMLEAARGRNWDRLRELEEACAAEIGRLHDDAPLPPLSGELRARKVRILQRILADDREIRTITEPWMEQLSLLLNSGSARTSSTCRRSG